MIHKVRTEEHDCGLNESRIQIMASISISHLWSRLCWNRPLQRCTTLTRHTLWHMHALVHILKYNHEITVSRLPLCMCHGHTRHTHKQWQTDKVSLSQRQNRAHCVKSNQCKHTIRGYQPRWQGREFANQTSPLNADDIRELEGEWEFESASRLSQRLQRKKKKILCEPLWRERGWFNIPSTCSKSNTSGREAEEGGLQDIKGLQYREATLTGPTDH